VKLGRWLSGEESQNSAIAGTLLARTMTHWNGLCSSEPASGGVGIPVTLHVGDSKVSGPSPTLATIDEIRARELHPGIPDRRRGFEPLRFSPQSPRRKGMLFRARNSCNWLEADWAPITFTWEEPDNYARCCEGSGAGFSNSVVGNNRIIVAAIPKEFRWVVDWSDNGRPTIFNDGDAK